MNTIFIMHWENTVGEIVDNFHVSPHKKDHNEALKIIREVAENNDAVSFDNCTKQIHFKNNTELCAKLNDFYASKLIDLDK
jgi:hypothetical protein